MRRAFKPPVSSYRPSRSSSWRRYPPASATRRRRSYRAPDSFLASRMASMHSTSLPCRSISLARANAAPPSMLPVRPTGASGSCNGPIPAVPDTGPAPASRASKALLSASISLVHWPACTYAALDTRTQTANTDEVRIVFCFTAPFRKARGALPQSRTSRRLSQCPGSACDALAPGRAAAPPLRAVGREQRPRSHSGQQSAPMERGSCHAPVLVRPLVRRYERLQGRENLLPPCRGSRRARSKRKSTAFPYRTEPRHLFHACARVAFAIRPASLADRLMWFGTSLSFRMLFAFLEHSVMRPGPPPELSRSFASFRTPPDNRRAAHTGMLLLTPNRPACD